MFGTCGPDQILNPDSGKCVYKDGKIGKRLLFGGVNGLPPLPPPIPKPVPVKPLDNLKNITPQQLNYLNRIAEFYRPCDINYIHLRRAWENQDSDLRDLMNMFNIPPRKTKNVGEQNDLIFELIDTIKSYIKKPITTKKVRLTNALGDNVMISKKTAISYRDIYQLSAVFAHRSHLKPYEIMSETTDLVTIQISIDNSEPEFDDDDLTDSTDTII